MLTVDEIYDIYYKRGSRAREILERHSRSVAELALRLNCNHIDDELVRQAAMLHDIGVFLTDAPAIDCHGSEPYIRHGILGADLLRRHGVVEQLARVAERHTGVGISTDEIMSKNLPLPLDRVLMPQSRLERLICYADKFYSKSADMNRKSIDRVIASMTRISPESLSRFESLRAEFGDP